MLKLLLIVLISSTTIFALHVDRKHHASDESEEDDNNESSEIIPPTFGSIKDSFAKSFSKMDETVFNALKKVFEDIENRLESQQFRDSLKDLQHIAENIFFEKDKLKGDEKTRRIVDKYLLKVNVAFENMLQQGIRLMQKRLDRTVDASHFKFAVDRLKQIVDVLY